MMSAHLGIKRLVEQAIGVLFTAKDAAMKFDRGAVSLIQPAVIA